MPKFTSKKTLRERLADLESALIGLQLKAASATALATIIEKENIQLSRRIKGLENQLSIKRSMDKKMDEFDKSLKKYDWEKKNPYIGKDPSTDTNIGYHPKKDDFNRPRWTLNERNFNKPFPNWEN